MKIIAIFVLSLFFSIANAQNLSSSIKTPQDLISLLNATITNNNVIIGQQCQNGMYTAAGFNEYVDGLGKLTGRYPGLIGLEYGMTAGNDLTLINSFGIKQWKRGGLVTVSWHVHNPWGEGYNPRWNSIANKSKIDFSQLVKDAPDSPVKQSYRTELTKVGLALKQLQLSGVIVLWRPFHESNGNWFWWGVNDIQNPTNTASFKMLWKDMYDTFNSMGVHNLVWVYTPNAKGKVTADLDDMYPGTQYVDAVGIDIYSDNPTFNDYAALKKFNKPIVMGEVGPSSKSYGNFDEMALCNLLRGKAAYFLQWNGWKGAPMGIKENKNYNQMMNKPYSLTLKSTDSN